MLLGNFCVKLKPIHSEQKGLFFYTVFLIFKIACRSLKKFDISPIPCTKPDTKVSGFVVS